MRGYGQTDRPEAIDQYTLLHLVGDMVGARIIRAKAIQRPMTQYSIKAISSLQESLKRTSNMTCGLLLRAFLHDASGDAPHPAVRAEQAGHVFMVTRKGGMMANRVNPPSLPPWLTEADVEVYVDQFEQTGYRGGLNWYRKLDRNWELLAPFVGLKIAVPALLIGGDRDLVLAFRGMDQVI